MKYLVNMNVSTRKNSNPEHKDWDVFIEYHEGDIIDKFPAHFTPDVFVASGHLSVIEDEKNVSGAEEVALEG